MPVPAISALASAADAVLDAGLEGDAAEGGHDRDPLARAGRACRGPASQPPGDGRLVGS